MYVKQALLRPVSVPWLTYKGMTSQKYLILDNYAYSNLVRKYFKMSQQYKNRAQSYKTLRNLFRRLAQSS